MLRWLRNSCVAISVVALLSCNEEATQWDLDGPSDEAEAAERAMRSVRSRQFLRFSIGEAPVEISLAPTEESPPYASIPFTVWSSEGWEYATEEDALRGLITPQCIAYELSRQGENQFINGSLMATPCGQFSECKRAACELRVSNCELNTLLELSSEGAVNTLLWLRPNETTQLEVGPQSAPTRAALAEIALRRAYFAVSLQGTETLDEMDASCEAGSTDREALESLLVEELELIDEAAERAWSTYIDVSTEYMSLSRDVVDAAVGARAIRLHAASLILGEFERTSERQVEMISSMACTRPQLSAGESEALSLIRRYGMQPSLLSDIGISNSIIAKELRDRYFAEIQMTPVSGDEFIAQRGVSIENIGAARQLLVEQMTAFHRDDSVIVRSVNNDPNMPVHAATAFAPTVPRWGAYFSSVRPQGERWGDLHSTVVARAGWTLRVPVWLTGGAAERRKNEIASEVRLVSLSYDTNYTLEVTSLSSVGLVDDDFLVVIDDERAVSCATTGQSDGFDCESYDADVDSQVVYPTSYPPVVRAEYIESSFPEAETIYLLERRSGAQKWTLGAYRLLAAFSAGTSDQFVVTDPVWQHRVDRGLEPNPVWCSECAVTCGDLELPGRLPLEDELTDDGDAYESSWRRYLTLARQAADEADRLGEQALGSQLEIETRAAEAQSELEALCGVSIALSPLTEKVASNPSADPLDLLESLAVSDADMNKLRECMGSDRLMRYVALGAQNLCVWSSPTDESAICRPPAGETDLQCPRIAEGTTCAAPAGTTGRLVADTGPSTSPRDGLLRIFKPSEESTDALVPASSDLCEAFRDVSRLAGNPSTTTGQLNTAWNELMAREDSSFWSSANIEAVARTIAWQARPDTHSRIVVNDLPLVGTGSMEFAPQADCGFVEPADCAVSGDTTLLCSMNGCNNSIERALINTRLARAAIVARWLGAGSLVDFVAPEIRRSRPSRRSDEIVYGGTTHDGRDIVTFENSGRNPSATQFAQIEGEDALTWIWARRSIGYPTAGGDICGTAWDGNTSSLPSNWESGCTAYRENEDSIGFGRISDRYPFGGSSAALRDPQRSSHRLRADAFLTGLPGTIVSGHVSRWVDTACPEEASECAVSDSRRVFPWVEAVDHRDAAEGQMEADFAMRYFLSLEKEGGDAVSVLPERSVYDALEILCEASRVRSGGVQDLDLSGVDGVSAVERAAEMLDARASEMERAFSHVVFTRIPESAFEAVRRDSSIVDGGDSSGRYGSSVRRLQSALEEFGTVPVEIASALRVSARASRSLDNALRRADNNAAIVRLQTQSRLADRVAECAASSAEIGSNGASGISSQIAVAAVVCSNAILQSIIALAEQARNLDNIEIDRDDAFIQFERDAQSAADALVGLELRARRMVSELDASTLELEAARAEARRLLGRTLFLSSDDSDPAFRANANLRSRLSTETTRYHTARRRAIGMALLAKRAIEQRFGLSLASLNQRMALVDAPATWEASLCTMEAMDFNRIASGVVADGSFDYADAYIGDYVDKLELFVESYRLDFPFQNAADTMVVSIRDDVLNVRAQCEVEGTNLLLHSDNLTHFADAEDPNGWSASGCVLGASGAPLPGCVAVRRADASGPGIERGPVPNAPAVFDVTFAPLADPSCLVSLSSPDCPCEEVEGCGFPAILPPPVSWGQTVRLNAGVYRLSWYAPTGSHTIATVRAEGLTAEEPLTSAPVSCFSEDSSCGDGWSRYWFVYRVDELGDYRFGIVRDSPADETTFRLAGLMLEDVSYFPYEVSGLEEPGPWVGTMEDRLVSLPACEDTDGFVFRRTRWRRGEVESCDGVIGGSCAEGRPRVLRYWETDFHVSQNAIDRGEVFAKAGFADGNFNYRIDSLAVNFVGSGVIDCSRSTSPSTCYSGGSVPYTIEHVGPYVVRNHRAETYEAPLFEGVIEHARGVATERYVSNPISSADRALVEPYLQRQFRGRPLTGTYRLRIWERDGVVFSAIDDVQVVMNYQFWTRFR